MSASPKAGIKISHHFHNYLQNSHF